MYTILMSLIRLKAFLELHPAARRDEGQGGGGAGDVSLAGKGRQDYYETLTDFGRRHMLQLSNASCSL